MASLEGQDLSDIVEYHYDVEDGLRALFRDFVNTNNVRVIGYSSAEVANFLWERLQETDIRSSLAILAALEAAFRIDYMARAKQKSKDNLSRAFRDLYKTFDVRVSFEDDILSCWSSHHPEFKKSIGDLKGALRFRHWIAHGRYWQPKLARKYDFVYLSVLATTITTSFPLRNDL
jgi:hypothetical protein